MQRSVSGNEKTEYRWIKCFLKLLEESKSQKLKCPFEMLLLKPKLIKVKLRLFPLSELFGYLHNNRSFRLAYVPYLFKEDIFNIIDIKEFSGALLISFY